MSTCNYIILRFFSFFNQCCPMKEFKQEYKRTTASCNRNRNIDYERNIDREINHEINREINREINIVNNEPRRNPLYKENIKEDIHFEFEMIDDLPKNATKHFS